MRFRVTLALSVVALCAHAVPAGAQSWASKMFVVKDHDFGTVARGADVVYRFEARNVYRQDIELVRVRSSCGCTTPTIENSVLKTHQTGFVIAKFNTRTFTGVHGATLTVTIQWTDERGVRRVGEAQLSVRGDIRSDVVVQPGAVRFDKVDQGSPSEQRVRITYAGRNNWRVTDVLSKLPFVEVKLIEHGRQGGRVTYDLVVQLKENAPAGELHGQLVLVTNDGRDQRIPVMLEGLVVPEISVAPASLVLGNVPQGGAISKKVVVRGKKPFRIVDVSCDDPSFTFSAPNDPDQRHVVEMTFKADRDPGEVRRQIVFATDLGDEYHTSCIVHATVVQGATDEPKPASNSPVAGGSASNQVRLTTGLQ